MSRIFGEELKSELAVSTTLVEGESTGTRPIMGTYFYLAPEIRAGEQATTSSDRYALGVTFFRLLTGMWYEPGVNAADYLARRKMFPPRTCGSVFKNPSPEQPAGRLLEEVGAKSLRVGGAYVWEEHANVIVAGDGCTSSDILALARIMAARVRARFGISLVPEIRNLCVD